MRKRSLFVALLAPVLLGGCSAELPTQPAASDTQILMNQQDRAKAKQVCEAYYGDDPRCENLPGE